MKAIIFSALVLVFLNACSESTSPDDLFLNAKFTLTDTTGHAVSQFHSNEEFLLSFELVNTTKDTLFFYLSSSEPPVAFRIDKGDSIMASSNDGYVFLMMASKGRIAPNESLTGQWQAPATRYQNPKVVLSPGQYQAKVFYPPLSGCDVNPVPPIAFTIVP